MCRSEEELPQEELCQSGFHSIAERGDGSRNHLSKSSARLILLLPSQDQSISEHRIVLEESTPCEGMPNEKILYRELAINSLYEESASPSWRDLDLPGSRILIQCVPGALRPCQMRTILGERINWLYQDKCSAAISPKVGIIMGIAFSCIGYKNLTVFVRLCPDPRWVKI